MKAAVRFVRTALFFGSIIMIKVKPLTDKEVEIFEGMFTQYYGELGCEDDCGHLLKEYVLPDLLAGLLHVDLLNDEDGFCGFVIYQIDDITNDWNFKEGWGDVREIYVAPEKRRQGLGKFLLYTAEMKLKESGAQKCYVLPNENSEKFFTACGYEKTDGFCADLDCNVFEKKNLNNCECGK